MTFRNRTLFYANRKDIKSGGRIRLDLTKDLYNLLVSARKRINNSPEVSHVYADINCRLKVKLADESHNFLEPWKNWMIFYLMLAKMFFSPSYFIEKFVFDLFLSATSENVFSLSFVNITSLCHIYGLGVLNIYLIFFASNVCNLLLKIKHFNSIGSVNHDTTFQGNSCR